MPSYGQFCPISRASEIFAERWTPLILREIMAGHHHFSEMLKGVHRISPSMLGQRLKTLERVGVIEARPNPIGRGSTYHLTEAGIQLGDVVRNLGVWGQQWLELERDHLDPDFLMWAIFTHLPGDDLPARRHVVRFEFKGVPQRYWLVLKRGDPDLCYSDPGLGDDVVVRANLEAVTRVYLGQLDLVAARRAGLVEIDGPRDLLRAFPVWFPRSGFAAHARAVRYDPADKAFVRVESHAMQAS